MTDRLVLFTEVLFRGDAAAVTAAREALAAPAAFIARHADDLGYFRPNPGWAPDPWDFLLDVGRLLGWVWVVDWREAADEIVAGVKGLVPAVPLAVDWDELAEMDEETREFLRTLARTLAPAGEVLVDLNDGSDSYHLALFPSGSITEAMRLAEEIGGKVEPLGT